MPLPDITLPQWCAQIGRRLPALPPRFALVKTLNLMLERGLLPADTDLELSTLYLQSCVAGLIGIWNCNPGQFDILPAAERILDTCFSTLQNGALPQAKRSA